jgi:hypothetical protein
MTKKTKKAGSPSRMAKRTLNVGDLDRIAAGDNRYGGCT